MRTPTTYRERFKDSIALLCQGEYPSDRIIDQWFDESNPSIELQEFCIANCPLTWSLGIAVIEAAMTLAEQPEEGKGHETYMDHRKVQYR